MRWRPPWGATASWDTLEGPRNWRRRLVELAIMNRQQRIRDTARQPFALHRNVSIRGQAVRVSVDGSQIGQPDAHALCDIARIFPVEAQVDGDGSDVSARWCEFGDGDERTIVGAQRADMLGAYNQNRTLECVAHKEQVHGLNERTETQCIHRQNAG